jgi:hypothetical protein
MRLPSLLASLVICGLLPAFAWAQAGGAVPPPQPLATPAGQPGGGWYSVYPQQAPLPPSDGPIDPRQAAIAPSYSPSAPPYAASPPAAVPNAAAPNAAAPNAAAPNAAAPNAAYATVPSDDRLVEFPAFASPTAGSRWMFSADAIWLQRVDNTSVILGNTVTDYGAGLGYVTDILTSTDVPFRLDAGVRLGAAFRFNDRNSLEATYFGLQQESVGRWISGDPVGNTVLAYSPWTQTDAIIGGFDNGLGYTYGSRVNSAELNQRLTVGGAASWSLAGLWGVRYFQVADRFNLNGSDASTGDFENLDIRTDNNLVGPQIGVAWNSFWNRLELTSEVKGALLANLSSASFSNLNSSGVIYGSPAGFYAIDQSAHATNVAGLLELSIMARYRLTEHFWLRGGYQSYFLDGLALGPRQLGWFDHKGGLTLDGPSCGIETNW